jgi:hypothetical protein
MNHKIEVISGNNLNEVYRILFFRMDSKIIVVSYSYEDNDDSEFAGVSSFIANELKVELSDISYLEGSNIWDADYWHEELV